MKITSFDSDSVDVLSSDIESALADVAEKRGIQIKIGKITFRSNQCAVAVEVSTVSESGEVMTREAEDFKAAASFFGLTPEHLGKTFRDSHGLRFRLVGLNLKARKHPFIIADVTVACIDASGGKGDAVKKGPMIWAGCRLKSIGQYANRSA